MKTQSGFTLIEVLIALLVFGLIATAAAEVLTINAAMTVLMPVVDRLTRSIFMYLYPSSNQCLDV